MLHNHPGYVSAPYNPFKVLSWQDKLKELELKYARWLDIGNVNIHSGLDDVNWMMQIYYPGNYTVVEEYNCRRNVISFKLKFESPHDELLFLLKWA